LISTRLRANAGGFVQRDELLRAGHGGGGVEGQARVHLGADAAGHELEDLQPEAHQHTVHHGRQGQARCWATVSASSGAYSGLLRGLEDQAGVGGGILRRELGHLWKLPVSATTVVYCLSWSSWFIGVFACRECAD
jgi:hypothetical protein